MADTTQRFQIVLTTAGSDAQAESLARALVERRVAACVNIVHGVCSVFHWKGEVTREEEKLLLIKTSSSMLDRVRETIRELHSYETPELIALAVEDGDPDYLEWLSESLKATRR
jgi:periplasmic divalent cation tolerance protein